MSDEQPEAYGAALGATVTLRSLVAPYFGQTINVMKGLAIKVPESPKWDVREADGGIKFVFYDELPHVTVMGAAASDVLSILFRPGVPKCQLLAETKSLGFIPLTPTIDIPLGCHE